MFVKNVLDLQAIAIFCLYLRKGGSNNTTKTIRLSKEKIKKQQIDSLFSNGKVETEDLNKKANKVGKSEDAATVIKKFEKIIRTKKKNIISIKEKYFENSSGRRSLLSW